MSDEDPYLYPGTDVLRNKLGIKDGKALDFVEREFVTQRLEEGAPFGRFDLAHLQAIHRYLFQDVYAWAGKLRTLEIAKGGNHFQHRRFIETGMSDIYNRLVKDDFLRQRQPAEFANAAAVIAGDLNYVHPFREGNGRTQMEYLRQLSQQAGHRLDHARLNPKKWLDASRAAHDGDYRLMAEHIAECMSAAFRPRGKQRR